MSLHTGKATNQVTSNAPSQNPDTFATFQSKSSLIREKKQFKSQFMKPSNFLSSENPNDVEWKETMGHDSQKGDTQADLVLKT